MALNLPYTFDTGKIARLILKFALGLSTLMVAGILKNLFLVHNPVSAGLCAVGGCILLGFGLRIYRNIGGSTGVLAKDGVTVEPPVLLGISTNGPSGFYALSRFKAVRVDRIPVPAPSSSGQLRPYERVYLDGKGDTPEILIGRTHKEEGRAFGKELGALLALPVEERILNY